MKNQKVIELDESHPAVIAYRELEKNPVLTGVAKGILLQMVHKTTGYLLLHSDFNGNGKFGLAVDDPETN
jgi:hypothetical protein